MRRLRPILRLLAVTAALPAGGRRGRSAYPGDEHRDSDGQGTLRAAIEVANAQPGPDSIQIEVTGDDPARTAPCRSSTTRRDRRPGCRAAGRSRAPLASDLPHLRIRQPSVTGSLTGLTVSGGHCGPPGRGILNRSGSLTLTGVVGEWTTKRWKKCEKRLPATGGGIYSERAADPARIGGQRKPSPGHQRRLDESRGGRRRDRRLRHADDRTQHDQRQRRRSARRRRLGASAIGGGIDAMSRSDEIERSTISGNSVVADGAALNSAAQGGGIAGVQARPHRPRPHRQLATSAAAAFGGQPRPRLYSTHRPQHARRRSARGADARQLRSDDDSPPAASTSTKTAAAGSTKSSDLVGVAAGLDPVLRDNGGPTPTHALLERQHRDRPRQLLRPRRRPARSPPPQRLPGDQQQRRRRRLRHRRLRAAGAAGAEPRRRCWSPSRRPTAQPPNTRIVSGPAAGHLRAPRPSSASPRPRRSRTSSARSTRSRGGPAEPLQAQRSSRASTSSKCGRSTASATSTRRRPASAGG